MKTLLTGLMTVALAATPIVTINQTTTQQEKNSNISVSLANYQDFNIGTGASVEFHFWSTSDSHTSGTANIICIDDYATSLDDFIAQFPKMEISNGGGYITQNYIGYTNPIYPNPHKQGNFVNTSVVLNTADLFKINQSIETQIGSYSYSAWNISASSTSSVITDTTEIAGKTFLTLACKASVSGNAGMFLDWQYVSAATNISKANFLAQ